MNLKLSENVTAEVKSINVYDETFFNKLLKNTLNELDKKVDSYNPEDSKQIEVYGFEYQVNKHCKIVVDMDLSVATGFDRLEKLIYKNIYIKNFYTFLEDSSNCDEIVFKLWQFNTTVNDFKELNIEEKITEEIEGERVN